VTTKVLNTKLLISGELLDIIIHFNIYCEALFNTLLLPMNRPQVLVQGHEDLELNQGGCLERTQ